VCLLEIGGDGEGLCVYWRSEEMVRDCEFSGDRGRWWGVVSLLEIGDGGGL